MATVCTLLWTRSMSEATPRGAKRAAPAPAPAPRAPWPKSLLAADDLVGGARRSSWLQESL